jgi:hypothetical protein
MACWLLYFRAYYHTTTTGDLGTGAFALASPLLNELNGQGSALQTESVGAYFIYTDCACAAS